VTIIKTLSFQVTGIPGATAGMDVPIPNVPQYVSQPQPYVVGSTALPLNLDPLLLDLRRKKGFPIGPRGLGKIVHVDYPRVVVPTRPFNIIVRFRTNRLGTYSVHLSLPTINTDNTSSPVRLAPGADGTAIFTVTLPPPIPTSPATPLPNTTNIDVLITHRFVITGTLSLINGDSQAIEDSAQINIHQTSQQSSIDINIPGHVPTPPSPSHTYAATLSDECPDETRFNYCVMRCVPNESKIHDCPPPPSPRPILSPARLRIAPSAIGNNTMLTIDGTGFGANETIDLTAKTNTYTRVTANTDQNGIFRAIHQVRKTSQGRYVVHVYAIGRSSHKTARSGAWA
jgi:hypothetical protein